VFKDYNIGLGNYIEEALPLKTIECKKENAFENYAKHHNQNKVTLAFASYHMTGDVELDGSRYNSYIHRSGLVIGENTTTQRAVRVRAIPITHPYIIDFWAQNKDEIQNLQKTFWIAVADSPIVHVFDRETDIAHRVSLDIEGSLSENVEQVEDRAGFYNSTVNVRLGVWIRIPTETPTISKVIIDYIESPSKYVIRVGEYS